MSPRSKVFSVSTPGIMQGRENFVADTSGTLSERNGYRISRTTLFLLLLFFLLSVVGVSVLVYKFVACPANTSHFKNGTDETDLCDFKNKIHLRDDSNIEIKNQSDVISDKIDSNPSSGKVIVDVRLPRSVIPISYDIQLIPFLIENNFTFNGDVKILVKIIENTRNITMHSESLHINRITVNTKNQEDTSFIGNSLRKYSFDEQRQFLILEFAEELQNGTEIFVNIRFKGILNDYLQGFYRSSYTAGNETRWVATTQFQPTDARRAFPCFDEPALKAKFHLTIARPKNMTSISNMPRVGEPKPVDGLPSYVWDNYQESVPMSTYLVAFVVSDFVNRTSGNLAVWARTDAIRSAAYALNVAPRILSFLEKFFDLKYPLPKMDMIALPDFSAGAMENWGLITYRETAMLYDEGASAQSNKQRVATVVAHELAHQWFGNLVTPSWWSDLWLNEGFASYMEYLGVDAVEPSWKSMDQFVVNELQNVFSLDALSTSHPISIEVGNPDEINEIFDRISYGKGAAIIRMMDHFLTTKVFQGGLTNYLKNKAYGSAEQDDLWHYLTEQARLYAVFDNQTSVKRIMDTWTLLTGFPIVNVVRDYTNGVITLSQERFAYIDSSVNQTSAKEATNESFWWIPITYATMMDLNFNNTRPTHWIRGEKQIVLKDIEVPKVHWIILNIQQTGYYRVNYDQTNWNLIIMHLNNERLYKQISPANRAQIIDDALSLARGGYISYNTAMDITKYLKHETDYVPWKAAINALNFLDSMLIKSGEYHKFKLYFLELLENVYNEVGFEDTPQSSMLTVYKRVDVLTAACHLGFKNCIDRSIQNYHVWMHEGNPDINNPISPNLKTVVYCTAIKYGDQIEWDFAWDRFHKTTISSEKEILLTALGCSRETWILTRYLERSMTDLYGIRKQDVFRVFGAVSNNVLGQPIAFHFIRNNWERMKEYLGSSMSNLNTILKYSTKPMNTEYELEELKEFSNKYKNDSGRALQQAIEGAAANIRWMDKNYKTIVDWLGNATGSS